ncbi:MAG: hypothetical protein U9Q77_12445 [Candidatus Marinimicrobia bacterium]|nr:hypothetical protein [Candidatus Neomarinimicrobiota bacterium]
MFNKTSKNQNMIMAVTAVVAGLFMMYVAPEQGMRTLKLALDGVINRILYVDPDFYPAVPILGATYGAWMVILYLAGAFAIVIAQKVYTGQEWARATVLGLVAIPAVSGMTMLIPWMVLIVSDYAAMYAAGTHPVAGIAPPPTDVSVMPPVLMTMVLGLVFYYVFLLADQDTLKNKLLKLVPYTAVGIVAGMVFMNGQHGVRYFIFIPEMLRAGADGVMGTGSPLGGSLNVLGNLFTNLDHYDALDLVRVSQAQIDAGQLVATKEAVYDPNTLLLLLGGYMNYAASYLMILAIPFLAMKKKIGYYMVTGTALATALIGFNGYIVRDSFEWAVGGFMSLILLVIFMLPIFKPFYLKEEDF